MFKYQQVPMQQQAQQMPVQQQVPVQHIPIQQQAPVQQVPINQQVPVQQAQQGHGHVHDQSHGQPQLLNAANIIHEKE